MAVPKPKVSAAGFYQPPQLQIPVHLLTTGGWVNGELVMPQDGRIIEYLIRAPNFIVLKNASILGSGETVPFFLVRRSNIVLTVPPADDFRLRFFQESLGYQTVRVSVLMRVGSIIGDVTFLESVKIDDFLRDVEPFVVFTQASFRPRHGDGNLGESTAYPLVIVATKHIQAVTQSFLYSHMM